MSVTKRRRREARRAVREAQFQSIQLRELLSGESGVVAVAAAPRNPETIAKQGILPEKISPDKVLAGVAAEIILKQNEQNIPGP